jgi:hypothetical protein
MDARQLVCERRNSANVVKGRMFWIIIQPERTIPIWLDMRGLLKSRTHSKKKTMLMKVNRRALAIHIGESSKMPEKEMGREDGETTSAEPEELRPDVMECMSFIQEARERAG